MRMSRKLEPRICAYMRMLPLSDPLICAYVRMNFRFVIWKVGLICLGANRPLVQPSEARLQLGSLSLISALPLHCPYVMAALHVHNACRTSSLTAYSRYNEGVQC